MGKQVMSFTDGGLISIKDPSVEISGLTYGDRVHTIIDTLTIVDHINKLEVIVTYNTPSAPTKEADSQKKGGMFSSLKSKLFSNNKGSANSSSEG